ncbi:pyridoxamine 5'-phosphate oxidase family protein [Streptomyces sp. UC4497]
MTGRNDGHMFLALDADDAVLVRTSADSELARLADGVAIAFEADAIDVHRRSGWSVIVTGQAHIVTDPVACERLARVGPRFWAALNRDPEGGPK